MECKEESVLESFFLFLSNFSHDRAKDAVSQESSLLSTSLGQLALAEKQYLSLAFLQPRTSVFQVRKEPPLRTLYQSLHTDLSSLSQPWAGQAAKLVRLRAGMVEVYERLSGCGGGQAPPYGEVTRSLAGLVEELGEGGEESPLAPWWAVVTFEVQALLDLLSAALAMQTWDFFPSLLLLTRGCSLLQQWEEVVAAREARKMSFASSLLRGVTGWVEPHLYLWLAKLKASLLSKFSLYFHSTLAKQTSPQELQRLSSRLAVDQAARLAAAQRKLDAQAVVLVYAGLEQGDCGRPGYRHPTAHQGSPTGLECFPPVYCCPALPDHLYPGLVMTLTDR